jgi:hypothetical protein
MVPDSPEEAIYLNMLKQADTFAECIKIVNHADNSLKEKAVEKALKFVQHYDEAIYVNMVSDNPELQKQAISKAISITNDPISLDYWATRAPNNELKALAKAKLDKLKKEGKNE